MSKLLGAFVLGLAVAAVVVVLMRPASQPPPPVAPDEVTQSAVAPEPPPPTAETARPVAPERRWRRPDERESKPAPASAPARPKLSEPEPAAAVNRPETPSHTAAAPAPPTEPAPAAPPAPAPEPAAQVPVRPPEPPPAPPAPRTLTIPDGTVLAVRLGEKISTKTHKDGDSFAGTLAQPLVVDGLVIADRNSPVRGKVVQSVPSGRVKGVAQLGLELSSITTSDKQQVAVTTAAFVKTADTSRGSDAAKIGAGAAIGAAIGAIAGGGRGAAIGAGAGGAAGAGTVMATRGKPAELPVETRLSFRLTAPVTITEKLN